ncbi:MAG: hypothetical protein MZU97_14960 [Bacillus subtilis]|nr:hypothetical protein [Bacillus subtilis]
MKTVLKPERNGVWDEFAKASKNGCLCIPVGSTGFMFAKEIWGYVKNDFRDILSQRFKKK